MPESLFGGRESSPLRPRDPRNRARRFHSPRWAVSDSGRRSVRPEPGRGGGGPESFRPLFALKGVLGSGAAFPGLGQRARHLPAAVGRSLPPQLALSGRRAPGSSAPGPHLCPAFSSPRQAFELDPLEPAASFPTADISPSTPPSPPPPQPLGSFHTGDPSLRALDASPFQGPASAPSLGGRRLFPAPSVSPSPPQSASHCLPPPPPLPPHHPPAPAPGGLLPHLLCHVVV